MHHPSVISYVRCDGGMMVGVAANLPRLEPCDSTSVAEL